LHGLQTVLLKALFTDKKMNKNKLIFLVIASLFLLAMLWIGIDISKRTTFPGSKGNLKERIAPKDTLR
jgi:hypothetical protein